jgi:hypothetical protein
MANVFDKIGDIKNNVNRSSFDWSHANNVTTGIGRITPIFCEELPPNSSLKIKANLGLQFMPMMYPVQTRMKVSTSFYKIPLRTLWKDYMNWVSSPNDDSATYVPPFISGTDINYFGTDGMMKVSGLADYLGVPVTVSLPGFTNVPNNLSFDPQAVKASMPTIGATMSGSNLVASDVPSSASWTGSSWSSDWALVTVCSLGDKATVGTFGCSLTFNFSGSYEKVSAFRSFVENHTSTTQLIPIFKIAFQNGLLGKIIGIVDVYAQDIKFDSFDAYTLKHKTDNHL